MGKLQVLEREASREIGPFSLFGLFLREDSPDRWDLAVATLRSAGDRALLNYLSARLTRLLSTEELVLISRIVPLNSRDRFSAAVSEIATVQHGMREIPACDLAGIDIARGFVISSRNPSDPIRSPAESR